jgi:hypothetical protein
MKSLGIIGRNTAAGNTIRDFIRQPPLNITKESGVTFLTSCTCMHSTFIRSCPLLLWLLSNSILYNTFCYLLCLLLTMLLPSQTGTKWCFAGKSGRRGCTALLCIATDLALCPIRITDYCSLMTESGYKTVWWSWVPPLGNV